MNNLLALGVIDDGRCSTVWVGVEIIWFTNHRLLFPTQLHSDPHSVWFTEVSSNRPFVLIQILITVKNIFFVLCVLRYFPFHVVS